MSPPPTTRPRPRLRSREKERGPAIPKRRGTRPRHGSSAIAARRSLAARSSSSSATTAAGARCMMLPLPAECSSSEPASGSPVSSKRRSAACVAWPMSKQPPVTEFSPCRHQRKKRRIRSAGSEFALCCDAAGGQAERHARIVGPLARLQSERPAAHHVGDGRKRPAPLELHRRPDRVADRQAEKRAGGSVDSRVIECFGHLTSDARGISIEQQSVQHVTHLVEVETERDRRRRSHGRSLTRLSCDLPDRRTRYPPRQSRGGGGKARRR